MAPDWMAGRRTQCTACWNAVRVPKRRWFEVFRRRSKKKRRRRRAVSAPPHTPPGETPLPVDSPTPVPSLPVEAPFRVSRSSLALRERGPSPESHKTTFIPTRAVSDGDAYRPNSIALRRQPRWVKLLPARREQHWYHSLTFPFVQLPVFLRLGLLQAVLTTAALIFWLCMDRDSPNRNQFALAVVGCLAGVFFVMGHTFHYFNAILEMACHGYTKHEPGIGCTSLGALVSCGHWLSCFLAGPALLFVAAFGYWIYCGDLTLVDWSILAELCFAGVGWWLIALLLTNLDDTVKVASPVQVVRTAFAMPAECALLTLLAAAVFLGHFFAGAYAIGQLHVTPLFAFPLLCACWSSGFYLTAFTFRRLGLTYYRAQRRLRERRDSRPRPSATLRHQSGIAPEGPAQ